MQTNFQAGVDTLYDKCVALGSTPTAKTPIAIVDAMDGISKYVEGEGGYTSTNVWHEVNLWFKPKILSVYFYYRDSSASSGYKLGFSVNHCAYGGLDTRYVQLTDTGFKYLTTQASYVSGKASYAAAG
jgi:hypothetical protein